MADRHVYTPRHMENGDYYWIVEDRPATITAPTGETSDVSALPAGAVGYDCQGAQQAGFGVLLAVAVTSVQITVHRYDGTSWYEVPETNETIAYADWPNGWTKSFNVRDDVRIYFQLHTQVGGATTDLTRGVVLS